MSIIETRDLSHGYGHTAVLKNINITIDSGETLGIIGPSGAGKSTLIRVLDLLETPAAGEIIINGEKAETHSQRLALRRRMSFVHQKPLVFASSVFENVAQPLRWRGLNNDKIKSRVMDSLAMVNLQDYASRQAKTLSGGETQRVALARALASEPEVLFLDEPTANLDPNSTTAVENLVTDIIKQHRLTVVMTTHDLAQGQRLSDRIGVLVAGELLQLGKADDIFMAPSCRTVAEFIGVENIWNGEITAADNGLFTASVSGLPVQAVGNFQPGDIVDLFIRPEDVVISISDDRTSARNHFTGTITRLSLVNPLVRLELDCGGLKLMALVTRQAATELELAIGKQVFAKLKATAIHSARGACAV